MALRKPSLNVKDARRLAGAANSDETKAKPAVSLVPADPAPLTKPAIAPEPPLIAVAPDTLDVDDVLPDEELELDEDLDLEEEAPGESAMEEAATEAEIMDEIADPVPAASHAKSAGALAVPKSRGPAAIAKMSPRIMPTLPHSHVKLQIFLSAYPPAPGLSKSYDMLIERYAPAKALQMILRRAMDEYEQRLTDGTHVNCRETYETDPQSQGHLPVQTSRIIAEALVERARRHFDPLGFESARAFGFKLATAALANFFAEEARYRRRNGS